MRVVTRSISYTFPKGKEEIPEELQGTTRRVAYDSKEGENLQELMDLEDLTEEQICSMVYASLAVRKATAGRVHLMDASIDDETAKERARQAAEDYKPGTRSGSAFSQKVGLTQKEALWLMANNKDLLLKMAQGTLTAEEIAEIKEAVKG